MLYFQACGLMGGRRNRGEILKYVAMIQARCGSKRLPNKVMKDLCGKPNLQWVIERVKRSKCIDEVVVVTSIEKNNLPLVKLCAEMGIRVFIGSEDDVLDRYYQAAKLLEPEYVVRITADCPLFDWRYLDMAIEQIGEDIDYMAQLTESFPDGEDIEIIKYAALKKSWKKAKMASEREHVTLYIKNHPELFQIQNLECPIKGIGNKRWTLDEEEDYQLINMVYCYFIEQGKEDFVTEDVLNFLSRNPKVEYLNIQYMRNEGLAKSLENDRVLRIDE